VLHHNHYDHSAFTPQGKWKINSYHQGQPPMDHLAPGAFDDNDQNSMILSPTCYYSPGTKIGRDLKDLNVLRDITVDDFWRNVPPAVHEPPLRPTSKKENDFYELYDFPAPIVSNEESSASPDGDVVTKHQWQSLYDSLLDCDDQPQQQQHMNTQHPATLSHNRNISIPPPRPRLVPARQDHHHNMSYHCHPRLSSASYGLRTNYRGHMWRGQHDGSGTNQQFPERMGNKNAATTPFNSAHQDEGRMGDNQERYNDKKDGQEDVTGPCAKKQKMW
jgi:hypothetical protein